LEIKKYIKGGNFVFTCRVRFILSYEYSTIWVDLNPTYLVNMLKILDINTTYLLNKLTQHDMFNLFN